MRRLVALLGILSLLLGLAACGDQKKDEPSTTSSSSSPSAPLPMQTASTRSRVSGEFGEAPEVKWNGPVDVDELDSKTLIEGTGDTVVKGDQAVVNLWAGNGASQKVVYSSYTKHTPEAVKIDDAQLLKAIYAAVVDHTVGSRVEVVAPPADTFGEQGNPSLGIGPDRQPGLPGGHHGQGAGRAGRRRPDAPGRRTEAGAEGRRTDGLRLLGLAADPVRRASGDHPDQGHRDQGRQGRHDDHGLPGLGLRQQRSLRRVLQQGSVHHTDRQRQRHQGLGPGLGGCSRSAAGSCW